MEEVGISLCECGHLETDHEDSLLESHPSCLRLCAHCKCRGFRIVTLAKLNTVTSRQMEKCLRCEHKEHRHRDSKGVSGKCQDHLSYRSVYNSIDEVACLCAGFVEYEDQLVDLANEL